MKYEILDDEGNVINCILADLNFVESQYPGRYRELIEQSINVAKVPQVITPFQAKAALLQAGVLGDVETLIANSDQLTQMAWNEALEFQRFSPAVLNIAAALNWTEEFLDTLFINAYDIKV